MERPSSVVGFASFRFVTQETLRVVYLFELHLEEPRRRQGLGSALLAAVHGHDARRQAVHEAEGVQERAVLRRVLQEGRPVHRGGAAPALRAALAATVHVALDAFDALGCVRLDWKLGELLFLLRVLAFVLGFLLFQLLRLRLFLRLRLLLSVFAAFSFVR